MSAEQIVPGSEVVPGGSGEPVPGSDTMCGNRGTTLYADIAALLAAGFPPPPAPEVLNANDGVALFYMGQVNALFGDPESGKTWIALAAVAETLRTGRAAAVIDLDHNGPEATVTRLLDLGAPEAALSDVDRFRYAEPEDASHLYKVVEDLAGWRPRVVSIDSMGELLPMFAASSNSPDDFSKVNRMTLVPLARVGCCVIVIDHLAKNSDSRQKGATGTLAKSRAVGGSNIRVTVSEQFSPGKGGAATLTIAKDRHGGLRRHRPRVGCKEELAGVFRLYGDDHTKRWDLLAPAKDEANPAEETDRALVAQILGLEEFPTSANKAQEAVRGNRQAVQAAYREAVAQRAKQVVPGSDTMCGNRGTTPRADA